MGKGSSSPPQVDQGALIEQQKQANRINQITPFGSVFFGQYGNTSSPVTNTGATGGSVAPGASSAFPWQANYDIGVAPGQGGVPINAAQLLAQQNAQQPTQGGTFTPTNIPGQPEGFQASSLDAQVTQFSPEVQALLNAQIGSATGLAQSAQQRAGQLPTEPFSFNETDARSRVEDAIFNRAKGLLDPVFAQQEERLRDTLANTGQLGNQFVNAGGRQELDIFNRNRGETFSNAALDAIIQGENVLGNEFQRAVTQRALPFNELASLLQGSQVNVPLPNQGIPGVDVLGPAQMQQNSQMAAYNAAQQRQQGLLGGLFGLGAAGIAGGAFGGGGIPAASAPFIFSDRRLKEDIKRVGQTDDGLPVYTYRYKNDAMVHMGVMADEVEAVKPWAVGERNGYKTVNYGAL